MSLNKAMLIGNLGRDAELKYTPGGVAVATINIATTEIWNKDGKKNERTEWHRCVIWEKQAESLAQYLVKGKQVYVEGRIQTRKWTDKNQIERYSTEIKVDRIVLLGGTKSGGSNPPHPAETTQDAPAEPQTVPDDDDIPF
jgi:single-strand DNA-binding protein